jgi:hypothetical protein
MSRRSVPPDAEKACPVLNLRENTLENPRISSVNTFQTSPPLRCA